MSIPYLPLYKFVRIVQSLTSSGYDVNYNFRHYINIKSITDFKPLTDVADITSGNWNAIFMSEIPPESVSSRNSEACDASIQYKNHLMKSLADCARVRPYACVLFEGKEYKPTTGMFIANQISVFPQSSDCKGMTLDKSDFLFQYELRLSFDEKNPGELSSCKRAVHVHRIGTTCYTQLEMEHLAPNLINAPDRELFYSKPPYEIGSIKVHYWKGSLFDYQKGYASLLKDSNSLATVKTELDDARNTIFGLSRSEAELEVTLEELIDVKAKLTDVNTELEQTKGELIKTNAELEQTSTELIKSNLEVESANAKLARLKAELEETQSNMIRVEIELRHEREKMHQAEIEQFIMLEASKVAQQP